MPSVQIYLNQQLFDFIKKDKSRIVQKALKQYIASHTDNTDSAPCPAYKDSALPK
jgi:hypothetical protein